MDPMSFDRPDVQRTDAFAAPTQPTDQYRPETAYNGSFDQVYGWQGDPAHQQLAPAQPAAPTPAVPHLDEAARERRAVTTRIVIALAMGIPLTGIATTVSGSFTQLVALIVTWIGIAAVVLASSGRPPWKS